MHSCPTQTIPIYAHHPIGWAVAEDPRFPQCTMCTLRLGTTRRESLFEGGMPLESGIFANTLSFSRDFFVTPK